VLEKIYDPKLKTRGSVALTDKLRASYLIEFITNTPKNETIKALLKSMYQLDDFYPFVDFLRNFT
jgi:hypothetical protein